MKPQNISEVVSEPRAVLADEDRREHLQKAGGRRLPQQAFRGKIRNDLGIEALEGVKICFCVFASEC